MEEEGFLLSLKIEEMEEGNLRRKRLLFYLFIFTVFSCLGYGAYYTYIHYGYYNQTLQIYKTIEGAVVTIESNNNDGDTSIGSGFLIDEDSSILTAWHVVKDSQKVWVHVSEKEIPWEAKILGHDTMLDTALLVPKNLLSLREKFLLFGDSNLLEKGQLVWAAGSPLGIKKTISQGRVINIDTIAPPMPWMKIILTDAVINGGNSGGPLVNDASEVVGINLAVVGGSRESMLEEQNTTNSIFNISVSVPINSIKKLLPKMRAGKDVVHISIGLRLADSTDMSDFALSGLNIKRPNVLGPIVIQVVKDSLAEKAGIIVGDLVAFVGKDKVNNSLDFLEIVYFHYEPGEEMQITVIRDNQYSIKTLK